MENLELHNRIENAAFEYLMRKDRKLHPKGTFDKQKRFYLDDGELCECCETIRQPSYRYPYSHLLHARTQKHVRHLFGVEDKKYNKAFKIAIKRLQD